MASSTTKLSRDQTTASETSATPRISKFGRLRDRLAALAFRLSERRSWQFEQCLAFSFWGFFLMHCTQLVHAFAEFPIDDPGFIYRAAELAINVCFFGVTLPLMVLIFFVTRRSDRRYGKLKSEDPGERARQRRRQIHDEIRQCRFVYADPAYRHAEEFVARETKQGWQLFLTAYRTTKADRARLQAVVQLVRLTSPEEYFDSPGEAIEDWARGFSVAGDHAAGMVYQIDGCEYSLRYALESVAYLGTRMEHLDGRTTFQHALDRFAPKEARSIRHGEASQAQLMRS